MNITVPLSTLLGESGAPGEAAGFGLLDAGTARDLTAAAARDPNTRWCVTAVHPDGTAAAHGCALGRHPPPPGPEPPGPEPPGPEPAGRRPARSSPRPPGTANLVTTCDTSGGPDQRPPPGAAGPGLPAQPAGPTGPDRPRDVRPSACRNRISAQPETAAPDHCSQRPLQRTRIGRPAARCDLDHTLAWHLGGASCECNLAPLCRHHHRCKQAEGWWLQQPEPGILKWRTPAGRTATGTPAEYSA